jgi:phage terminase small subunit
MSRKKNGKGKSRPPETPAAPPPADNVSTLPIPDTYRSILKGFKAQHVQFILQMVRPRNPSISAAYAKVYPGCSEATAYTNGSRLLRNARIAACVEKIRLHMAERVAKRLEVTEEKLVSEMAKIAYADAGEYGTWDKDTLILKDSVELPPDLTAAIESVRRVETAEGVRVEVKFHDKKAALDSLFRYKGLFKDRSEVTFTDLDALMAAINGKSRGLPSEQALPQK